VRDLWKTADRRYPHKKATPAILRNRLLRLQRVKKNAALERRKKAWFNRHARDWDRANPTPLTWEKRKELEAEFAKTDVPTDRSGP
jgi:hypothetical protein